MPEDALSLEELIRLGVIARGWAHNGMLTKQIVYRGSVDPGGIGVEVSHDVDFSTQPPTHVYTINATSRVYNISTTSRLGHIHLLGSESENGEGKISRLYADIERACTPDNSKSKIECERTAALNLARKISNGVVIQ